MSVKAPAILFACACWCAAGCVVQPASPDDVKKKAIARAMSLSSYRATIETEMFAGGMSRMIGAPDAGPDDAVSMKASGTIETWVPDRMRSVITVQPPPQLAASPPMRFEIVFDGATVWVSSKAGDMEQHHRVDQKLAVPGHPFDVGFNMRGGGLVEGEDLRGSVLFLLNTWTFTSATPKKIGDKACTELRGTIDEERALDAALGPAGEKIAPLFAPANREAFAMQRLMMTDMMGRALAEMRTATVCVSADGDVLGWSLGSEHALLQRVTVTSFERNPTIPVETFAVAAATKAAAVDVSETVRQSRAAPPVEAKELAAFRAAVRATSSTPSTGARDGGP
jgi:hypothetical protein